MKRAGTLLVYLFERLIRGWNYLGGNTLISILKRNLRNTRSEEGRHSREKGGGEGSASTRPAAPKKKGGASVKGFK